MEPTEIGKLTLEQLRNERAIQEIGKEAEDIVLHFYIKRAWQIVRRLEKKFQEFPDLSRAYINIYKKYQEIMVKLKFIALVRLSPQETVDLIKNHFGMALGLSLDLIELLKFKLIGLPFDQDENLREAINVALERSENRITQESLDLGEEVKQSPTIANWLRDYRQYMADKKERGLARAQYFFNTPNTKGLTAEQRETLRKLIEFYEFVNTSSLLPAGYADDEIIEWPDGQRQLLIDGEFIPIIAGASGAGKLTLQEVEEAKADALKEHEKRAVEIYERVRKDFENMRVEEGKILKTAGGKFDKLSEILYQAVNPPRGQKPERLKVLVSLKALMGMGGIEVLLKDSRKFVKSFTDYLTSKNKPELVSGFSINPTAPKYLSFFLRYILEDRLGLSEHDSASIGIYLANMMTERGNKKYEKMVYYDLEKGEFRWY